MMWDLFWELNMRVNQFVWGPLMIGSLLGIGAWFMVRTRFLPISRGRLVISKTIGSLFSRSSRRGGITPFQAVSTALAGTLGVGSVVGVATAIAMGGAGAVFWMWVSALAGMMIKYAEVILSIHYRQRLRDGSFIGGPMITLTRGCHMKWLGIIFACLCILASFGIGNTAPANTIAITFQTSFQVKPWISGVFIAIVIGIIMGGKAKRIMQVNALLVPILSILYIGASVYLIILNRDVLVMVIQDIFTSAFRFTAVSGGIGGYAMSRAMHYGLARGVFSNEAGMGSAPIAHASVTHVDAVEQGFWGIFEVFFDTMVICTISALLILTSSSYQSGMDGVQMIVQCFVSGFGTWGGAIFACAIASFALSSMLGWYYYATQCLRFLFDGRKALKVYQILFLGMTLVGACAQLEPIWEIADTINGLMCIPNLISIIMLYKVILAYSDEYLWLND